MIELLLMLHLVLFMFAFALTAGIGLLTDRIAKSGDPQLIHRVFSAARPLSMMGGFSWILSALLGVALAAVAGMDLKSSWLVCSYAAFAVLIVVGFLMHAPWQARVIEASATPGPELEKVLNSPSHPLALALSAVSVGLLLYLMTARPG